MANNVQSVCSYLDKQYIEETCILAEKMIMITNYIDKQFEEKTCLQGGQMTYRETNWDIAAGAYKQFIVSLEDSDDLSNARKIQLTLKSHYSDSDAHILLTKNPDPTLSDLSNGKMVFVFRPDDTKELEPMVYWFDVWVDLTQDEKYQVVIGHLNIRRNVWKRY